MTERIENIFDKWPETATTDKNFVCGGVRMCIKERIDGLTEEEAKAALLFVVKQEGRFIHDTRWILCKGQETIEEFENKFLDIALKEARK